MRATQSTDKTRQLSHPGDRRKGSPILTWTATPWANHKIRPENQKIIKDLAKRFMTRAESPDLIPVDQRNALALEYWIGAAALARAVGMTVLNDDIAKLGALEIAPRGYRALCELALY